MPSADSWPAFRSPLGFHSPFRTTVQASRGKSDYLHRTPAGFTAIGPWWIWTSLPCASSSDRDCLTIRFLFVRSRLRSTLPSDPASRRRPCASLDLHLHQVGQGTLTPELSDMLGTHTRGAEFAIRCHAPGWVGAWRRDVPYGRSSTFLMAHLAERPGRRRGRVRSGPSHSVYSPAWAADLPDNSSPTLSDSRPRAIQQRPTRTSPPPPPRIPWGATQHRQSRRFDRRHPVTRIVHFQPPYNMWGMSEPTVGYAKMVCLRSRLVIPARIARANRLMSSSACGPSRCAPRIRSVFSSRRTL